MRFLPPEVKVTLYETAFDNEIIDQSKTSKSLSEIVDRIEDPLVIALDGQWGTGKSYFLKRWVAAHTKQNGGKALTIYFDAFAHDYLDEPLISIVSAVSTRVPETKQAKISKLKAMAAKVAGLWFASV